MILQRLPERIPLFPLRLEALGSEKLATTRLLNDMRSYWPFVVRQSLPTHALRGLTDFSRVRGVIGMTSQMSDITYISRFHVSQLRLFACIRTLPTRALKVSR